MKKIRIGILGCANIVDKMMGPAIKNLSEFDFVAIASRDIKKAIRFSEKFDCDAVNGYQELVERKDIDAIYIPLPIALHEEWAIKAIRNGKHVICEKSLSINYKSVQRIIKEAKSHKKVLFENFMFLYHSQIKKLKECIDNDWIGDIKCLRSSFGFPIFQEESNIRYKKQLGGGSLLDAGAYTIKLAQFVLGFESKILGATLTNHSNYNVDFNGGILMKSKSGIFAQLAFGFDNYYQCNMEIWGDKGKIILERAFTAAPGFMPKMIVEKQNEKSEYILTADNHFEKILQDFYDAIITSDFSRKYNEIEDQARLIQEVFDA